MCYFCHNCYTSGENQKRITVILAICVILVKIVIFLYQNLISNCWFDKPQNRKTSEIRENASKTHCHTCYMCK